MSGIKKLRKGQARLQFVACKDRIEELHDAGCNIQMIYNALLEEGLISMTYGGFYENYTQRRQKSPRNPVSQIVQTKTPQVKNKQVNAQTKNSNLSSVNQQARRENFGLTVDKNISETERLSNSSPDIEKSEHDELLEKYC